MLEKKALGMFEVSLKTYTRYYEKSLKITLDVLRKLQIFTRHSEIYDEEQKKMFVVFKGSFETYNRY